MRLTFLKGDFLAIGMVAAAAVAVALCFGSNLSSEGQKMVGVYRDGELLEEFPLQEDRELIISGKYTNRIVSQDGRVSIEESDCPGTDCVYSGEIAETGRSIVCLPNRVEVRIDGAESDVDIIVR